MTLNYLTITFLTLYTSTVFCKELDNKIVGGREADIEDHPYQVNFIVNNTWFCGGFIISENWIMTAAHCIQDTDPETIVLRAGSAYRKNGTKIPITEVKFHPDYNNPPFDHDIGVMRTAEPIVFTDTIQAIPLASKGQRISEDSELFVSGWGLTEQGGKRLPDRLMEVTIDYVNWYQCYVVYPTVLTKHMLCGGSFFFGGKSTCQGDSGGTALIDGVAFGIVSFGRGCGQPLSPSVFANVASLRDWITQETGV